MTTQSGLLAAPADLRRPSPRAVALACVFAVLALAPFALSDVWLSVLDKGLVAALFALSFNLLFGQAGMLSFGHAAFFGIGSFAAIHAMKATDAGLLWLPTPLIPLSGGLAGLIAGGLAGLFACKRSGVYFAMVTLAMSEVIYTVAPNMQELFGGESGISGYRSAFLMFNFGRESHVYVLILVWFALCALLLRAFQATLFGRLAVALRESETRLPALGYSTYWTKVVLFAASGMFAGIAGALLSLANESANYNVFSVGTSSAVVLQTFIGGTQVFLGPAVGALVMTVFGYVVSDLTRSWMLYQGLLFIVLMLAAPRGLAALAIDAAQDVAEHGVPALARLLLALAGSVLAGLGIVLVFEVASGVLTGDYQALRQQTGAWPPVSVLWRAWDPASLMTWVLPAAALAAGLLLVRRAVHGSRA